jgi:WD40 repeat protein
MIRLWDVATGKQLLELKGHTDVVWALSFTPDGKRLASGSWDRTIKIWETERGTLLATFKGHKEVFWKLHFIHDGTSLVSATHNTIGIWAAGLTGGSAKAESHSNQRESAEGHALAAYVHLGAGRLTDAETAYDRAETIREEVQKCRHQDQSVTHGLLAKLKNTLRLTLVEPPVFQTKGQLLSTDPHDAVLKESPHRVHVCKLESGKSYFIELKSRQFDAHLRVETETGQSLAEDDDSGGDTNSLIYFRAPHGGEFRIIATCFTPGDGDYILTVNEVRERKSK